MKEKLRKIVKSRIFIFVCAALLFGTIGVSAATYFPSVDVTYDNEESGLVSTDVQGAIDELYVKAQQVSSGSDDKVEDMGGTVSSGDGLYADSYESGRYFYRGKNPNNYITFNGEKAGWRIISIEPDGTIKIMRTSDINTNDNLAWDTSGNFGNNNWARPSSLNTYLNGDYYNSLNSTAKNQIVSHTWKIGPVTNDNGCLTDNVNSEGDIRWSGKVGLATVSEYLRSSSNVGMCRTFALNNDHAGTCANSNWMVNSSYANWWTLSSRAGSDVPVFLVYSNGTISNELDDGLANYARAAVRPTLYLSSSVTLSGSGTSSNPYTLGQV